jgi:opacity protein-like surface antigen
MRRLSLAVFAAAVSTTALTQIAFGADQAPPVYKSPPPPPAPVYTWTGFYAGLNAGYGWGTSNNATTTSTSLADGPAQFFGLGSVVVTDPTSQLVPGSTALANAGTANVNQKGFIGGGQIGYNVQWGPNVVLGIEADFQGSDIHGSGSNSGSSTDRFAAHGFTFSTNTIGPNFAQALTAAFANPAFDRSAFGVDQVSAKVNWLGTVRGRAGYLLAPNFLIYATGGLAYGRVSASGNYSLDTNLSFTADSFALAFAEANGPGALVGVSATAGTNVANASATSNTQNIQTQNIAAAAGNSAAAAATATIQGLPGTTALSLQASATPGTGTALTTVSNQAAGQSVTNFVHATTVPQTVTARTISQAVASGSDTKFGGTIGGGFEWKFSPRWSFKTEALYYNLGKVTIATAPQTSTVSLIPAVPTFDNPTVANKISSAGTVTTSNAQVTRVKFDGVILRAGINYQFMPL